MTCTAYSCQVMATTRTYDDADKARLSKSAVVGRALALADAEGLDALTVRRLAQELGVTPMALYWHFRSKEELLTGLATQIWGEIRTDNDAALRATEVTLDVLRRGGFDPVHASEIARSTLWTGLMLVMSEPGYDPGLTDDERAEQQRRNRVRLAMLPPDRYPRLVEAAAPMTSCDDPEFHTRFGVDLFIAGVEAMARRSARSG